MNNHKKKLKESEVSASFTRQELKPFLNRRVRFEGIIYQIYSKRLNNGKLVSDFLLHQIFIGKNKKVCLDHLHIRAFNHYSISHKGELLKGIGLVKTYIRLNNVYGNSKYDNQHIQKIKRVGQTYDYGIQDVKELQFLVLPTTTNTIIPPSESKISLSLPTIQEKEY